MHLSLLVLRAEHPHRLAAFYEALGLRFKQEKHGSGPEHLSCELNGAVFEIYPRKSALESTQATRVGFAVPDLDAACQRALAQHGELISGPSRGSYGLRAVLRDPEGHRVELLETLEGQDGEPRRQPEAADELAA